MDSDPRTGSGAHHDRRVLLLALLAGLPGVLLSLWFLWHFDHSARLRWTVAPVLVGGWIGFAVAAR
jgi:hypothetical protein